jgi:hypothetical protein
MNGHSTNSPVIAAYHRLACLAKAKNAVPHSSCDGMARAAFSEFGVRSGFISVGHVNGVLTRLNFGMYLDPNDFRVVFSQAWTERSGMFHLRGAAKFAPLLSCYFALFANGAVGRCCASYLNVII